MVETFLSRNFDIINQITKTAPMMLEVGFIEYPERLAQTALLHVWAHLPPIKGVEILPANSYESLRLLADPPFRSIISKRVLKIL